MDTTPIKNFAAALLMASAGTAVHATNFSFSGNFEHDNDVQRFNFTVGAASTISLRSWSYAGGTNAAGTSIARGGFDPILALYKIDGTRLGEQDDAGCSAVAADAVTGNCWDTFFSLAVSPGEYIATIMQYDNFSNGNLGDGFKFDGVANQNFRNGFLDDDDNQRDSHWAFDILNVETAVVVDPNEPPVSEPATLPLLGLALLGAVWGRRRLA